MPGKPWRVSEVRTLTDAIRSALAPNEIPIAGRSPIAVRRMAARLGLIGDGVPRKRWTDGQRAKLAELVGAGWTATRIAAAALLPHNRTAVQTLRQRTGLGRPDRSAPQKAATRLHGAALDRFHAFVRQYAASRTPGQVARLWNQQQAQAGDRVSQRKVAYHLGQLGLRPVRRAIVAAVAAMPQPVVRAPGLSPMPKGLPRLFPPAVAAAVAYAHGA